MKSAIDGWFILSINPKKLPEPGERVIICVGERFVGEGYLKYYNGELKWKRYCDFAPIDDYMGYPVTAWRYMPKPPEVAQKKTTEKKTQGGKDTK